MDKTERFSISMPSTLLEKFDQFLKEKGYHNRSEAIRDIIREKLVLEKEWECTQGEVVGILVIVYSLKFREISHKVSHHQHEYHQEIISTLHIHIDKEHCLETIVIKGNPCKVKEIADEIGTTRGVIFYKLIPATTGKSIE